MTRKFSLLLIVKIPQLRFPIYEQSTGPFKAVKRWNKSSEVRSNTIWPSQGAPLKAICIFQRNGSLPPGVLWGICVSVSQEQRGNGIICKTNGKTNYLCCSYVSLHFLVQWPEFSWMNYESEEYVLAEYTRK